MKFLKTRVLPLFLTFVLSVSMLVVPASASGTFPDDLYDDYSVGDWNAQMNAGSSITLSAIASYFGINADPRDVFWHLVDGRIGQCYGEVGLGELEALAESFNQAFNTPAHEYFLLQAVDGVATIYKDTFAQCTIGTLSPNFKVTFDVARNVYRIIETNTSIYVVDSAGRYPYVEDDGEYLGTDQWLPISAMDGGIYRMLSKESIYNLADDVGGTVYTRGNYLCITKAASSPLVDKMVLANEDGKPYVCWKDKNQSATEQERPTTNVTENGNIVEGDDNSVNLDLEGMTMLLPGGTLAFIDQIIYDESTKSYHIDSHDTYNYEINNYYTWNYYINYTSITYIGQTEEYNKYYEVYYELPDGRSSADLTKEDLEQLNLSVDVIPYGRSADDTSLRSLYHFDGDTKDSSYWNYCTDFTWDKGASLTYMDAGVFDGALYLDELEHQFTFTLPSNIGSSDFTLQFRYYQSATAAPVTDSSVKIGDGVIFQMDGSSFKTASGTAIAPISIGNWQEVCLMRSGGTLRLYHNGLPIFTYPVHANYTGPLGDTITFTFGSSQQTFKYFDEFRFINKAVYDGDSYEPSSVPHDTNLTLVLPDTAVPVADEYWSFKNDSQTNILTQYGLDHFDNASNSTSKYFVSTGGNFDIYHSGIGYWVDGRYSGFQVTQNQYQFPYFTRYGTYTKLTFGDDGFYIDSSAYPSDLIFSHHSFYSAGEAFPLLGSGVSVLPASGIFTLLALHDNRDIYNLPAGTYTLTLVTSSGAQESVTFTIPTSLTGSCSQDTTQMGKTVFTQSGVGGYEFGCMMSYADTLGNASAYPTYWLFVRPESRTAVTEGIVYMELVEGDSTSLEAEKVQSVIPLDKADLHTPTLAVRTDIDITSYQIGGVRPSLPEKGMVWAMVENERIASLQVYNGQAWEGVDGRIWTGERWIPMSSYNIITLQDLYDIVDATPNYEYIYSEAGFWSWWQKSWNAFQEKLFQALGSGGSGGGSIVPGTVKQKVSEALSSMIEGIFGTITEVLKSLIGAASDLLSGIFGFLSETVLGGIKDFFSSLDELVNPFESTVTDGEGNTTTSTELPEGISAVFAFFSGLFLIIPEELRIIMLFGIGLLLLLAVFKMVKA